MNRICGKCLVVVAIWLGTSLSVYAQMVEPLGLERRQSATVMVLSPLQQEDILYLVEMNKMARDLYLNFAEIWEDNRFVALAQLETEQIDSIRTLMERYGVILPETLEQRGVFENGEIGDLYIMLETRGLQSHISAIQVGMEVEHAKVADLDEVSSRSPTDVRALLLMHMEASRRHLAALRNGDA